MKSVFFVLLIALVLCEPNISSTLVKPNVSVTTTTPATPATQNANAQAKTLPVTPVDKNQIPSYDVNAPILEELGKNYPTSQTSRSMSLLQEHMIADGKNQFSRIHAEIQKNNEKPIVYDKEEVTPVTIDPTKLTNSLEQIRENLVSANEKKAGLAKQAEDLQAGVNEKPVLSSPDSYTLPKFDFSAERQALREHQDNTAVQLHRLLHAMDMISESIYDPLRDQYAQGVNEMLDHYLSDPVYNRQSPLYRHIAAYHNYLRSPDRVENLAEAMYQNVSNDKDALRQKTLEHSQIRH